MAYTEIFGFDKEGKAYSYGKVENAFRSGMAIWSILENKYLPPYIPKYAKAIGIKTIEEAERRLCYKPSRCTSMMEEGAINEVWDLADNKEVLTTDKICLFTTFDNCLVKKEDLEKVIKAFREFDGITSLKEQSDILEKALSDEKCIAIGWNQTSVNGKTWSNYEYDEENDCEIPYNCITGEKHYWLFDELNQEL